MGARAIALLLFVALPAGAVPVSRTLLENYRADQRISYVRNALQAVRRTPTDVLEQGSEYARVLARGACSSGATRLKVECLMTAVRRYCHNRGVAEAPRCELYMDVLVANVLADERLITAQQRYQIMRTRKDYRGELQREMRRIQGALAVDFRLRTGEEDDDNSAARNIDHYCLTTSDETNLPWQTCVSSLVWFIYGATKDQQ